MIDGQTASSVARLTARRRALIACGVQADTISIDVGDFAAMYTNLDWTAAICMIEQLGTLHPVISPQAGEVARFLVEDGAPVMYGQTIVELSPFFGGHIIGDSKHL